MAKIRLTLVGAGKIGEAIVTLLDETGDYDLTIFDKNPERLRFFRDEGFRTRACVLDSVAELVPLLAQQQVVISACPYHLTPLIASAAKEAAVHYFDLTEDVESTRAVKRLAQGADTAFVPQCGLAPGFIS